MAKAIIFTGSTGAGHTLAALSLEDALKQNGDEAYIIDAFAEGGSLINRTVTRGYQQLVEYIPKIYRLLYHQFDSEDSKTAEIVLNRSAKLLRPSLLNTIAEYNPDLIISTHPIITNILGRLKDDGEFDKPILSFITDYKVHEVYLRDSINAYVVGSDYTKASVVERGVDPDKIYAYGIPIRKEFRTTHTHHLDPNKVPTILLMAGSLGSRQIKKAFSSLLKIKYPLRIIAVCGNNKRIKSVMDHMVQTHKYENKEIEILGFTKNISELMDEADILITKPGGLTSTEAISKNIPIIIPYTYPGQEEENADYLVDNGMALSTDHIKDLKELIENLLDNHKIIDDMSEMMSREAEHFSIDKTVELCENLAEGKVD